MAGFLGMDDDDEDEDDEDEDDDDDDDTKLARPAKTPSLSTAGINPLTGKMMDPYDPSTIVIKPRPGKYGFVEKVEVVPDEQLVQTMTADERKENLEVMRRIRNFDLKELRQSKDHPGWVEANNDLKARTKADPWFGLNERLTDAIQMGETDDQTSIQGLIDKLGGPPPQITVGSRGYALYTDIFEVPMSTHRAENQLDYEIRMQRAAAGRAMAQERKKNLEKEQRDWEETMRNPMRENPEIAERREKFNRRIAADMEVEQKRRKERAKDLLGKLPDMPTNTQDAIDRAVKSARADMKRLKEMRASGRGLGVTSDEADVWVDPRDVLNAGGDIDNTGSSGNSGSDTKDDDKPMGAAAKAREAATAEASGGRPRLPGDTDVTRGEIDIDIQSSSTTTTGPLEVQVSSTYNTEQSDPPMRKHCFQYTIRITNNSPTDTVQLLGRKFEIQTVGSSMKDVVQGEGVTGRQPVLKPGEVFEYTSTAPLSVRPIGTTIIAARMKGEYKYIVFGDAAQETATPEQMETGGDQSAELGMFHFVFPDSQRVKPVVSRDEEDDDDSDDDDDDDAPVAAAAAATPGTASASAAVAKPKTTPSASPAATLPGDEDLKTGDIQGTVSDASDTVTDGVRVQVTSSYRPERSDGAMDKHCFAYNIRITNENTEQSIQLVSRRFEIQTIGSPNKDVVQGPGVTGRQPILKPGESFEYTSTAPLSVKPMTPKTPVVARMQGEYNFVQLADDGSTPLSSTPLQANLGKFHFILPALA
jgi:ApaG protein